jgi:hypothetical protein
MTGDQGKKVSGEVTIRQNGNGVPQPIVESRSCAFCGTDANTRGPATERFGEVFCSEGHAEEFVKEVRVARVEAAALRAAEPTTTEIERPEGPSAGVSKPESWKHYLKLGACCGAPLLALVFLAGGGGAVLGAAGALLPYLALLACPLGMYFMMRSMGKMGHGKEPKDKGEDR